MTNTIKPVDPELDELITETLEVMCRDYIHKYNSEYIWGENDCCQFVRTYVSTITGIDRWTNFKYSNKREAYKIISQYGSIDQMFEHDHFLGESDYFDQDDLVYGDVVMVRTKDQLLPAIVNRVAALCMLEDSLSAVTVAGVVCGWHIGGNN